MGHNKRKRCHSPSGSEDSEIFPPRRKRQKCEEARFLLERLRKVQRLEKDEHIDALFEVDRVNGKLGVGSFATVCTCRELTSGNVYACKEISKQKLYEMSVEMRNLTYNEAACFTEILPDHENIVKVHKIYESPQFIYIIMELLAKETLADSFSRYSSTDARTVFRKIVEAVRHLHLYGVVHNDLNIGLKNICFRPGADRTSPVIVDLNMSHYLPYLATRTKPGLAINHVYSSSELKRIMKRDILDDETPSFDDDVVSLGKILSVLLTGERQPKVPPSCKPGCHPEAIRLLSALLDPIQRRTITVEQILNHPWFHYSD